MASTKRLVVGLAAASALVFGACADDEGEGQTDLIEVAGTWSSSFGGTEVISDTRWGSDDFAVEVVSFDNEARVAITRNDDDAEFSPGAFNKNVWTAPAATGFHYCTVAFGLATADDAEAADESGADATDLDGAGCNGFSWTHLTR